MKNKMGPKTPPLPWHGYTAVKKILHTFEQITDPNFMIYIFQDSSIPDLVII